MNSRTVGIFAVVVALLVGAAIWFLYSDFAPHAVPTPETTRGPEAPKGGLPAPSKPDPGQPPRPPATQADPKVTPPTPAPVVFTEDDRKIDEALKKFTGNTEQYHTNTA